MGQNGNLMRSLLLISALIIGLLGCNPNRRVPAVVELAKAPVFNSDSAYSYIEQQVGFGYRVPGMSGHQQCGDFILAKLDAYGFTVSEQRDTVIGYDSKEFPLRNIIGKWNEASTDRILLCAHWDSRPFADQDADRKEEPIDGANDNASGVAVLLEIARAISSQSPTIGVDMVFFDLEDQGRPVFDTEADPNDHGYCLGSKYWSEHFSGIKPKFGILLDMVGAKGAQFTLEHFSWEYANSELLQVWDLGNQLGYSDRFIYNRTGPVFDDHMHINQLIGIPCIDIIQRDVQNQTLFWSDWHTHADELDAIDKQTLESVGQTVTQVIYNLPNAEPSSK